MSSKMKKPLTTHQILTIIALVLPNFLGSASFSVIDPFFPTEVSFLYYFALHEI